MKGLGILCPGQGNQHPAMFDKLMDDQRGRKALQAASSAFGCPPAEYLQNLSSPDLFRNQTAQLLIATLQMATWSTLRELVPQPQVFAGYSMGELACYGCAGSLDMDQALNLVKKRAAIMDEASPQNSGLMAIRGLNKSEIERLCEETGAEIAIVNTPDHFILGGSDEMLRSCEVHSLAQKASKVKRLAIEVPSHTSGLLNAGPRFATALDASGLCPPFPPVLAGVSGGVIRTRKAAIFALTQQISHPINWLACMQTMVEIGCEVVLELGPGDALSKMMRDLFPDVVVRSVEDFRSLQGVAIWIEKQCH